ncbi:MAG: VOC family protein [Actinomycetales bacterium]|nr:VOC family protein [Actinomycetales bacterium]
MRYVGGFSGFSVRDVDEARAFYRDVLGLTTHDSPMGAFELELPGSTERVFVYGKGEGHSPATYTVLNLVVPDIDAAVDALEAAGGHLERYESMPVQDARGIARSTDPADGPTIAWLLDPSGNVVSFIESSE